MGAWHLHLLPSEVAGEGLFLLLLVYLLFMLFAEIAYLRADGNLLRPSRWNDRQHLYLWTPPIVLLHELGHASMLSVFSRARVDIHYRLYYGYTTSPGFAALPARQRFWVALGGTLFTVAAYHAAALALHYYATRRSGPMHYDAEKERFRRAAYVVYLQQGLYALVWYPILSIPLSWGDFSVIYAVHGTPWLSLGWAVAHALLLLPLFRAHAALYGPDAEMSRPLDDDDADLDDPGPSVMGEPGTFAQLPRHPQPRG